MSSTAELVTLASIVPPEDHEVGGGFNALVAGEAVRVRAVLELGGVRDILAKSLGTTNPINMLKATVDGLQRLRRPEEVAQARGLTVSQVLPIPVRRPEPEEVVQAEPEPAPAEETSDGETEDHTGS